MYRKHPNNLTTRQLAFRALPADGGGRAVEAVIASDEPCAVWSWQRGEVILEALPIGAATLPEQCPLLLDHDRAVTSMVGSVVNFRQEGGSLLATLRFAEGNQAADSVWSLVAGRHLRAISVGYRVSSYKEIRPGQTATVAGRTYTAPAGRSIFVAERWELKEASCVPVGADDRALIRSEPTSFLGDSTMPRSTFDIIGQREASYMTVVELAKISLSRRNQRSAENHIDTVRAAFGSIEGASDLIGRITTTVLSAYRSVPESLAGVYQTQPAPNYLQNELAELTIHPRLGRIGKGGVAPAVSLGLSQTGGYRLGRFGCQFALDEQDIIDGRTIGVIEMALAEVGVAARRFIQDLLWSVVLNNSLLSDETALFHADRGNLGSVELSDANLDAAMAAIAGQTSTDVNGDPIHLGLSPKYLVVPPAKLGTAKRLVRDMQTGDSTDVEIRAESRLSTTGIVDPTATEDAPLLQGNNANWLLAAPAAQAPSLILCGLFGRVEPEIRSFILDQGQWGIGFDLQLSIAAAAVDGRPLYWSTGGA